MQQYTIYKAPSTPGLDGEWDGSVWGGIPSLDVDHFHEKGSDHRPVTQAKAVYDDAGIYVIFRVEDRYVRCVETRRNGSICADSCAEFFVEPVAGLGYFNFEINAGGTLLLHYNDQSAGEPHNWVPLDESRLDQVKIYHSLPQVVDPEIEDPTTWIIEYFAPYELFEADVGPVTRGPGTVWRGNFYKCGDATSHPHWAMWNRVEGELSFHKPEWFAPLPLSDGLTG